MSTEQPDALRLATILGNEFDTYTDTWSAKEAAAELRRQHAEIETLRTGYSAARLEIASLKAQLAAVGAGGVEPLRKRECLHQISEPAQAMLAHFLEKEAPRIDAAGLDAERHCCEHTLYLERERLHAAIAAQKENHD